MIAIPNMDKPKECKECQWHLDFYIEDEQVGGLCTITEKDDKENTCPLIEIDLVRCKECKKHGKNSCPMTFTYAVITDDNNYCSYAERRTDE